MSKQEPLIKRHFTKEGVDPFDELSWEKRTALIGTEESPVFFQEDVEVPSFWSQNATNIVAQKYFAYDEEDPRRESSVKTLINRVVKRIAGEGMEHGYFQNSKDQEIFAAELKYILVHQLATFNSPVWFNIGVEGAPQQASACFILDVEDNMDSIARWYGEEMKIFKGGSGAGLNVSKLRSSGENLSKGGIASGPVTFMRGADANAGTIKSGGRCLAPDQCVYTESGPVRVDQLAKQDQFICVSYDPPAKRYKLKRAQAWQSGQKNLLEIKTDKGVFKLSPDHPVKLSDNSTILAGDLEPGHSLFAGTINYSDDGYLRLGLKDGKKTKEKLHRLVAKDILNEDVAGKIVHHVNGDKLNNHPDNLEVMTDSLHGKETAALGEHIFQKNSYSKIGKDNPMHSGSDFWQDEEKAASYKSKQAEILKSRDTKAMQDQAADQRMINFAFKIINAGGTIDTFKDYYQSRKQYIGSPGVSKKVLNERIVKRFGSHENFVKEVSKQNHRVISVTDLGESVVYDVEVFCPTADDKTPESGHNFLIWPSSEKTGSGIVVFNTRRAAKLICMDADHPDVEDFVNCKVNEEERIRILANAGLDMGFGPEGERNMAEATSYQNANNSVRVTDKFMQAVEADQPWGLVARTTGETVKTISARELMKNIADAAWRCADPGLQYDTTINKWHTTPAQGNIEASNPCFPGSARVHTNKGLIPFSEFVDRVESGEDLKVFTDTATTDAPSDVLLSSPTAVMRNGIHNIIKLTFSDGRELRCTETHRLWTTNRGWVEAVELTSEDRVKLNDHPNLSEADGVLPVSDLGEAVSGTNGIGETRKDLPSSWSSELAEVTGFLTGDGCITDQSVAWVYGRDDVEDGLLDRHKEIINQIVGGSTEIAADKAKGTRHLRVGSSATREMFSGLGVGLEKLHEKRIPESVFKAPSLIQASYLKGLFSADGCVVRSESGKASRYVGLASSSKKLLLDAQKILSSFGINPKIYKTRSGCENAFSYTKNDGTRVDYQSKDLYDLRITGTDLEIFASQIGFASDRKQNALDNLLKETKRYSTKNTVQVVSTVSDGREEVYNLTEPIHHSYIVDGIVVANCSEYMSNNNTACNLASLNLKKFFDKGEFLEKDYIQAARVMFTAQDITISFAEFPTRKIAQRTTQLRQIGLGYSNLGALLMSEGLPYDSDQGRALAASLTSLLTATAYNQSAQIASRVGAFAAYEENEKSMQKVMSLHKKASLDLVKETESLNEEISNSIAKTANRIWQGAIRESKEVGFRNAQATVLAPCGTISFFMDCDTTGIEPDFALIKHKVLSGGGSVEIINQSVYQALISLGYTKEQTEEIVAYIAEEESGTPRNSVVNSPHLRREHYSVFDCAVGEREVAPIGHVKMVAAVQPFLSGAVSKTVNVPTDYTPDDIMDIYIKAWEMGTKSISVYRDGSKANQPLNKKESDEEEEKEAKKNLPKDLLRGERRKVSRNAPIVGVDFRVGQTGGYIHVRLFKDGTPGAIFIDVGQAGSTLHGFIRAWAVTMSLALQYGMPLDHLVRKLAWTQFEPAGITNDPEIKIARSIVDYVVRWLAKEFLDPEASTSLGIDVVEEEETIPGGTVEPEIEIHSQTLPAQHIRELDGAQQGQLCDACGGNMVRTGSCYTCTVCGSSSGCG
jgi:ribonucleoside-diphosphate reductase alpha chain